MDDRLREANAKLKSLRTGVTIRMRGGKLYLRATLPPKPGKGRTTPYQQEVSVGVNANPAGLRRAIEEAKKMGASLALKEFSWADWIEGATTIAPGVTVAEAIDKIRRQKEGQLTEHSWINRYGQYFRYLDPSAVVTDEMVTQVWERHPINSASRSMAVGAAKHLALAAGLTWDKDRVTGNGYRINYAKFRRLPTDEAIVRTRNAIADPSVQYVYGLMATYGLRNHEVFLLDPLDLMRSPGIARVLDGKTGGRQVWPCYPEWWSAWELWRYEELMVKRSDAIVTHPQMGGVITRHFRRHGLGLPYDLRHAWAVRTSVFGWPVELAARQMGHSLSIHVQTYHHWLTEDTYRRTWEILMTRSDRPMPPT